MTVIDNTPAYALLTLAAILWAIIGAYIWLWFNGYTGDE